MYYIVKTQTEFDQAVSKGAKVIEIQGNEYFVNRTYNGRIVIKGNSAPLIYNLGSSAPLISNQDSSAPSISNQDSSAPSISNYNSSAPLISNRDSSAPRISNFNSSAPSIYNLDSSAPSIYNLDSSAPQIFEYRKGYLDKKEKVDTKIKNKVLEIINQPLDLDDILHKIDIGDYKEAEFIQPVIDPTSKYYSLVMQEYRTHPDSIDNKVNSEVSTPLMIDVLNILKQTFGASAREQIKSLSWSLSQGKSNANKIFVKNVERISNLIKELQIENN